MAKLNVGVLYGGPSYEHNASLETGRFVLESLPGHLVGYPIFVGHDGRWREEEKFSHPERVARRADVAFIAMHGDYGEDGKVQRILDHHGIPYVGSGSLASAHSMNKAFTRELLERHGIAVPRGMVLDGRAENTTDMARRVFVSIGLPVVVKPNIGGSSLGVSIVTDYRALPDVLSRALHFGSRVLVEEYIRGREASCGVLEDFRNEELYALPPIEGTHCPAPLSREIKSELQSTARLLHSALGCRHYSCTDFIIAEEPWREGRVYTLELNTLPKFTAESLYPKSAQAIGLEYPQLLDHLINIAIQ